MEGVSIVDIRDKAGTGRVQTEHGPKTKPDHEKRQGRRASENPPTKRCDPGQEDKGPA